MSTDWSTEKYAGTTIHIPRLRHTMKSALITGVCGQDGSYLAEVLLGKGYQVFGLDRPGGDTSIRQRNIAHLRGNPNFMLIPGDLLDNYTIAAIAHAGYDEIYHLAAQSHVGQSFESPVTTANINFISTTKMLDQLSRISPDTKLYFAATSEMFGRMQVGDSANEHYPLTAHSPYAVSKIAAFEMCKVYRRAHGMYIVNGISFNHESPRRGPDFVTKRIADGIKRYLKTGMTLKLGNVEAFRDWHHAIDTANGMYLAMQQDTPADYVFASGEAHSVREWLSATCRLANVDPKDAAITNTDSQNRPLDVNYLRGNPTKAEQVLGWRRTYNFQQLVEDVYHGQS